MAKVHHSAICTHDIDASLEFWRDGVGFSVLMDMEFPGDWPTLFGAPTESLRSLFLGDAADPDGGIVELVDFGPVTAGPTTSTPAGGFFLLSVYVDLDFVLQRLLAIDPARELRQITVQGGIRMAVVRDPNGVLVELIDQARVQRMT
jgi:glyoxylase I family protein